MKWGLQTRQWQRALGRNDGRRQERDGRQSKYNLAHVAAFQWLATARQSQPLEGLA